MTKTITTRELQHNLPKVKRGLSKGMTYWITCHGKPVGTLSPVAKKKEVSGADFVKGLESAMFKGGDPLLSQKVDTYLYGAPYAPNSYK